MDIVFVNTNSAKEVYQDLALDYAAIEPPTWSLLLAQSCRAKGFGVCILDAHAENLTHEETAQKIIDINPKYCCFVTYSSNPNGGTANMVGVYEVARLVKDGSDIRTISIGSHTSALPYDVLGRKNGIDYVALGEGVYTLHRLLSGCPNYENGGLGYLSNGGYKCNNNPNGLVSNMDEDMPGYAWDLLPYNKKPFDLYRAHTWHAEYQDKYKTPFASMYTSLGCKFTCEFCMINTINRTNPALGYNASHTNTMRFWSPELILKEFDKLINYGITTIRLSDEMFFLNKKYYEPILKGLKDRGYGKDIRMWTYARIDTINERFLDIFREGGVKWLAVGIEAANQEIRREITKGRFENVNIRDVIKKVNDHGLYVGANYIFGHPEEKLEHLQETLDLALDLNTEFANFYTAMALPGSPLYYKAKDNGWELPNTPEGWSFLSYECKPLPTKYLQSAEILKFRDEAWQKYFTNPKFLELINNRFGSDAVKNIQDQSKIKLKRKILGD